MNLPVQKISENTAKYLILLGARGQKPGKSGFGVELGRERLEARNALNLVGPPNSNTKQSEILLRNDVPGVSPIGDLQHILSDIFRDSLIERHDELLQ